MPKKGGNITIATEATTPITPTTSKINPLNGLPYSENYYKLLEETKHLPANQPEVIKKLHKALDESDFIIVDAGTGTGKGVVIVPEVLKYYDFKKRLITTEPSVINVYVADRVGALLDDVEGKYINYAYRYNVTTTKNTILSFETDGRILNYFYKDPSMQFCDILVVDEIHENNAYMQYMLKFMKDILSGDNPNKKKLIIMSATMKKEIYQEYFKGIKTSYIKVEGKTFPIESIYLKTPLPSQDAYEDKAIEVIKDIINIKKLQGNILVFVPSVSSVTRACNNINNKLKNELNERVICLTLFKGQPEKYENLVKSADEYKKLKGNPERKIIFSTNYSESGITLNGITIVIDSGLSINADFDTKKRIKIIKENYISKFEIAQRKGRVGRTSPGTCYHLYTEEQYNKFQTAPDNQFDTDKMDGYILDLFKVEHIKTKEDVRKFYNSLILPPPESRINDTFKYFEELNMYKSDKLTSLGECLLKMQVNDYGIGIALLYSKHYDVFWEMLHITAMQKVEPNISKWFRKPNSDNQRQVKEFLRVLDKYASPSTDLVAQAKLFKEYRDAKDKVKWANNRFINLFMFDKAKRASQELHRNLMNNEVCFLKSNIEPSKNMGNNLCLALTHGFYNQSLKQQKNGKYLSRYNNIEVEIKPRRFNNLSKTKTEMLYIEMMEIGDKYQCSGLINL